MRQKSLDETKEHIRWGDEYIRMLVIKYGNDLLWRSFWWDHCNECNSRFKVTIRVKLWLLEFDLRTSLCLWCITEPCTQEMLNWIVFTSAYFTFPALNLHDCFTYLPLIRIQTYHYFSCHSCSIDYFFPLNCVLCSSILIDDADFRQAIIWSCRQRGEKAQSGKNDSAANVHRVTGLVCEVARKFQILPRPRVTSREAGVVWAASGWVSIATLRNIRMPQSGHSFLYELPAIPVLAVPCNPINPILERILAVARS